MKNLQHEQAKQKIVELLRLERYTSKEIAAMAGVSEQVVMGVKSHWTLGKYGDAPRKKTVAPSAKPGWTYLLLSCKGEVYLGATTDLRSRLRSHNSPTNLGFTKGRRWHLLACRRFNVRKEAFDYETSLKTSMTLKYEWKLLCIPKAKRIAKRFAYPFDAEAWDASLKLF